MGFKVIIWHLIMLMLTKNSICTIDLNRPELEYLANHLTLEQCHKLIASLHVKSYELPSKLNIEDKIPADSSCLQLLLDWNSSKDDWGGFGKTHEEVQHRLRQIGRNDLANWLGKVVFHQLAQDLEVTLINETLGALANETVKKLTIPPFKSFKVNRDIEDWTSFDKFLCLLIVIFIVASIFISVKLFCIKLKRDIKDNVYKKIENSNELEKDKEKYEITYSENYSEITNNELSDVENDSNLNYEESSKIRDIKAFNMESFFDDI